MASARERSRSPRGATEHGSGTVARSLNLDKMELALDDKVVKVYRFTDEPEMPWFQAKPIVTYLDYTHITWALDRVDGDDKMTLKDLTEAKGLPLGGCVDELHNLGYHDGKSIFINEPGLYSLILGSKKKEAREFKRWITHEVLPTLRRCGHYTVPGAEAGSSVYPLEHLQQIVSGLHQDLRKRDDKMSFQELVNTKGVPLGGGSFNLPPLGYHDSKAMYISECGMYSLILKDSGRWY